MDKNQPTIGDLLENHQRQLSKLGDMMEILIRPEAPINKQWILGVAGSSTFFPFKGVKSLYVDNSANPNPMQIRLDGELGTHLTPALSSGYIPCEGAENIAFEGIGSCKVLCMNRAIPPTAINANTQAGNLPKLSTDPFPAGVDGNTCIEFWPDNTTKSYYYYLGVWRVL